MGIYKFGNKYLPSAYKTQFEFRSHFSATYWTARLGYLLLTVFSFKSLSVYNPCHHQRFLNVRWAFKLITHGYEPPTTDASKPNKQYTDNVQLHTVPYCASVITRCIIITTYHFSACPELNMFFVFILLQKFCAENIYIWASFTAYKNNVCPCFMAPPEQVIALCSHSPLRLITLKNRVRAWKLRIWRDMGIILLQMDSNWKYRNLCMSRLHKIESKQ
jgi:hypothetical protein